jgi:hypothetical protein
MAPQLWAELARASQSSATNEFCGHVVVTSRLIETIETMDLRRHPK